MPNEVYARMGPLPMPSIDPKKTTGSLRKRPGHCCKLAFRGGSRLPLPQVLTQPLRARVGLFAKGSADAAPIRSRRQRDPWWPPIRCAAGHCWWRRSSPGWHRTAVYAVKPQPAMRSCNDHLLALNCAIILRTPDLLLETTTLSNTPLAGENGPGNRCIPQYWARHRVAVGRGRG